MTIRLLHGHCRRVLKTLAPESIDACVTDPPYGLKFMGKKWDAQVPPVADWQAVYRVLKPGAHLLAFGGEWEGWGTALKPAQEPIVLARKPLDGTVADNVQEHGTGALNVGGCRIDAAEGRPARVADQGRAAVNAYGDGLNGSRAVGETTLGRWPANVVHDGSDEVVALFPDEAGAQAPVHRRGGDKFRTAYGKFEGNVDEQGSTFQGDSGSAARFFYCAKASRDDREDGLAHLEKRPLLWSSGTQNPGSFQAEGTDRSARNNHPTVKPTELMRWLCRLITPKGGVVLDPFMGSGSTGRGAFLEGFDFIGIEREAQWMPIAEARIRAISPLFAQVSA